MRPLHAVERLSVLVLAPGVQGGIFHAESAHMREGSKIMKAPAFAAVLEATCNVIAYFLRALPTLNAM